MSKHYHTPLTVAPAVNAAVLNAPLEELDSSIGDLADGAFQFYEPAMLPLPPPTDAWKLFPVSAPQAGFRIMSAAGVMGGGSLVESLFLINARTELGADVASITIASIPQIYRHLMLLTELRQTSDPSGTLDNSFFIQYNGASGADYVSRAYDVEGTMSPPNGDDIVGTALTSTGIKVLYAATCNNNAAGFFGPAWTFIYNYTDATRSKSLLYSGFTRFFGTSDYDTVRGDGMKHQNDNTAITSLVLLPTIGNFKAGSAYTLYGIR